ncbi:MAG TPA: DUF4307 domain-containing protein [Cellulomonas sp.]
MSTPPAGRYGPAPTTRTTLWRRLGLAVLVLAAVAVLTWLGITTLRDPVQWRDVGYHVNGSTSIQVTFDVTKATSASATCRVHALSEAYAEVGVMDVPVGPGTTTTQRVTVTIPTSETAVTGTVQTCSIDG